MLQRHLKRNGREAGSAGEEACPLNTVVKLSLGGLLFREDLEDIRHKA